MKQIIKFLAAAIICCFSITSFAQFNPVPMTVCEIVATPIDEMDVVTFGIVTDVSPFDKFDLTFDGCTILCDTDFGVLPAVGMLIIVEGRVQEEDLLEDLTISVRYWIPYEAEPPGWPDPVVFTVEDANDSPVGTIALLFGYVQSYSDEDEGTGTFLDETGSMAIDFPDGDSPDAQENVHVLGTVEENNFGNPIIDVSYWYPEGGNPPPDPPAVAWSIEEANTLPLSSYCFIPGMVTSWTNENDGEGVYDDGENSMNIDFESDVEVLPGLDESIFVLGLTREEMDVREIETHHWFPEELVGVDDPVALIPQIRVYPNPASSVLYVDAERQISRIIVYSINGAKVKEISQSGLSTIDVSDLNPGVYVLTLFNDNGFLVSKKLVIE